MPLDINGGSLPSYPPLSEPQGYLLVIGSLLLLYLLIMYGLFGSINISHVVNLYNQKTDLHKRYDDLFAARENLLFHISWAKQRGEGEEARRMMAELVEVDKVK